MLLLRQSTVTAVLVFGLTTLATGQQPAEGPILDYSYCRFDSATIYLLENRFPKPILNSLAGVGVHPRVLPVFITAKDINFYHSDSLATHKLIYATNGGGLAALELYERQEDGAYKLAWEEQKVPPAGHVKLQFRDLNGDGRLDVIATARGGEPVLQAMAAFDYLEEGYFRPLLSSVRDEHDPRSVFGIAATVNDTLGRDGRPAIEVWQDDTTNTGYSFVRVVQQYSDSAKIFIPEAIDTFLHLPYWCQFRRPGGRGQK